MRWGIIDIAIVVLEFYSSGLGRDDFAGKVSFRVTRRQRSCTGFYFPSLRNFVDGNVVPPDTGFIAIIEINMYPVVARMKGSTPKPVVG